MQVLLRDLHGDVVGAVSTGQSQSSSQDFYSAYGERTGSSSSLGFQGQYTDSDTSQVDMLTRHYLPGLGRFSTRDALFGELTSPMSLNQFAYGGANPVTLWDPAGMAASPRAPCGSTATLPGGSVLHGGVCGGSFLTFVHTTLDLAGFVPGAGAIPDLINAGIYGLQGDWKSAALSGVAAIPLAGDAAKGGHMLGELCSERCDEGVELLVEHVDDADDAAEGIRIMVRIPAEWDDEMAKQAIKKIDALSEAAAEGRLVVTGVERGESASRVFRKAGRDIPEGYDVDHIIDLQLGGTDDLANMALLNSTVNRSLGAQIAAQLRGVPEGTSVIGILINLGF